MVHLAQTAAEPATIRASLSARTPIADDVFDKLYPDPIRALSRIHWTPVAVALRAAALLAPEPGLRVLDVGAGSGKVCCIGALASNAAWYGVERDPNMVGAALKTARLLGVESQTHFKYGDMRTVDWADYASVYLFNPFEAGLFELERSVLDVSFARYAESVTETEQRLADLPAESCVVTYHGFGGEMPDSYDLITRDAIGGDQLVLWVKRPPRHARGSRWWGFR